LTYINSGYRCKKLNEMVGGVINVKYVKNKRRGGKRTIRKDKICRKLQTRRTSVKDILNVDYYYANAFCFKLSMFHDSLFFWFSVANVYILFLPDKFLSSFNTFLTLL
jgi:hypothetical protein